MSAPDPCTAHTTAAVFFDIDGTLLNAGGAGRRAFARAMEAAFGIRDSMEWVEFAGATDLDILRQVMERQHRPPTQDAADRFFAALTPVLREEMGRAPHAPMPGVTNLLTALSRVPGMMLGLVTGNIGPCARLKLEAAGIHGHFTLGAYGHEHGNRNMIAHMALDRARRHCLHPSARVTLIGDTPSDISAAHAIGARCLAVATGRHTLPELQAAGADWVLPDLKETDRILKWILSKP